MKFFPTVLSTVILVTMAGVAPVVHAAERVRIAVLPFEYGAVVSQVGSVDVGKGVSSLMITRLVKDGTYSVIEREALDSILKEQNVTNSNRANPATAAQIGKLLGVDAIVVGTITQFGFESKNMNVGAAAGTGLAYVPYFGGWANSFGAGSLGVHKSKVKVGVDARVVDINTGEILAAVSGEGESKRGGASLWGSGGGRGGFGSGGFDFGSSNFASSIAGEATIAAVDSITSQLTAVAGKVPQGHSVASNNVQGRVADVDSTGNQVCVNVGKINGLKMGDQLLVEHPYKTIKDPDTGKVLRELSNSVAVISLTDVSDSSSMAQLTKGGGIQTGDYVRSISTSVSAVLLTPSSNAEAVKVDSAVTASDPKDPATVSVSDIKMQATAKPAAAVKLKGGTNTKVGTSPSGQGTSKKPVAASGQAI